MDIKRVILRIALFSMCLYLTACRISTIGLNKNITQIHPSVETTIHSSVDTALTRPKADHLVRNMSIAAVGDVMFHNTQLTRAYRPSSGTFDFSHIFEFMKPYLTTTDLLFGNLETTFNGPYGDIRSMSDNNVYGYSGYPTFNTPDTALDAIFDAGFDVLSTANNHALDKGTKGMNRTVEQLDRVGIAHTGTFSESVIHEPYLWIEKNGFTFAIVNYTYATNGIQLPKDTMARINTLNNYDEQSLELLYDDVTKANESNADFVVVMLHFGNEYQEFESERYQEAITLKVLEKGADIVFGGHPHVLQPIRVYTTLNDIPLERPKLVIYSLGNFIASQHNVDKIGGNTDLGVVFQVYLQKIDDRAPRITGFGFLPTFTLWQSDIIMTIPVNNDFDWINDEISYVDGTSQKVLSLNEWDKKRIQFASLYTIQHLMTYEANDDAISKPYEFGGYTRYDILTTED